MKLGRVPAVSGFFALIATLVLAACGGGGGGSSASPSVIPVTSPTPGATASATPTATVAPSIVGQLTSSSGASFGNANIYFSCGCTGQAGEVVAAANGTFTISSPATAVPASPSPTYTTVPGRNYLIVGQAASGAQAWTMGFLGNTAATTLNLYGATGLNTTDQFTTATALYTFYESSQFTGDQTFDHWNFNSLAAFAESLRLKGGNNAQEIQFLTDIVAAQNANQSLFPGVPPWDPTPNATPNATIANDIKAVATSGDAAIPTPCPNSVCTGGPTPLVHATGARLLIANRSMAHQKSSFCARAQKLLFLRPSFAERG